LIFQTQSRDETRYRHTLDAALTIYRSEGIRAFYRGLLPSLLGITHVAVQFPLYERLKIIARTQPFYNENNTPPEELTYYPPHTHAHARTHAHKIHRTGRHGTDRQLSAHTILFCSAVAKMVASVATYPHEVVRTRLQTQRRLLIPTDAPRKRSGIVRTTTKIIHFEGWRGLYKGLSVNLIRTVPNSAVTMLTCVQVYLSRLSWTIFFLICSFLLFNTPQIRIVNASPYGAWHMIAYPLHGPLSPLLPSPRHLSPPRGRVP